jgi:hypothetical protein
MGIAAGLVKQWVHIQNFVQLSFEVPAFVSKEGINSRSV